MINNHQKLQNLRQVKNKTTTLAKVATKPKLNSKRKNSKDKRSNKMIENRKLAAKVPLSFEGTAGGYIFSKSNSRKDINVGKPINTSAGTYAIGNQRNSSLEEYNSHITANYKNDMISTKGHKRSDQDNKKLHMTINNAELAKFEDGGSTSPYTKTRAKYTKEKLKNITTHLGTGASRNSASKGIMTSTNAKSGK